jgi:hypothetical protein
MMEEKFERYVMGVNQHIGKRISFFLSSGDIQLKEKVNMGRLKNHY